MAAIGTPSEYVALLKDGSQTLEPTQAPVVFDVPWESLAWGRRESDVSAASVVFHADCLTLPALHGWDQELLIFRDGTPVWWGPVTGWSISTDGRVEIAARDIFAWTKKRLLASAFDETDVDVWAFITSRLDELAFFDAVFQPWARMDPTILHDGVAFGKVITKAYRVNELKTMYELLRELVADFGLFFTAHGINITYDDTQFDLRVPLSLQHLAEAATLTVDASNTAEVLYIAKDSSGAYGYADVDNYGPLGILDPYATLLQQAVYQEPPTSGQVHINQRDGRSLTQLARHYAPTVDLEEVVLAPTFGGGTANFDGINDLCPGLTINWMVEELPLNIPTVVVPRPTRIDVFPPEEIVPFVTTGSLVRVSEVNVAVSRTDEDGIFEKVSFIAQPWTPFEEA